MKVPVNKLTKKELVWLFENNCKAHATNYASHYACFLREKPEDAPMHERLGFLDIEASNLDANWGIMLCYSIYDEEEDKSLERIVTPKELRDGVLDRKVVEQCVKDMQKFDRVITYYGTRFDIPYIRTRALWWKIPFPTYKELLHTDVYYIIRNKFKFNRNRLGGAYDFLVGDDKKTHYGRDTWIKAAIQHHQPSLDYIMEHCRIDAKELCELWNTVNVFTLNSKKSI